MNGARWISGNGVPANLSNEEREILEEASGAELVCAVYKALEINMREQSRDAVAARLAARGLLVCREPVGFRRTERGDSFSRYDITEDGRQALRETAGVRSRLLARYFGG